MKEELQRWLRENKITLVSKDGNIRNIPICLHPAIITRHQWDELQQLQHVWNQLVYRIAQDGEFLQSVVAPLAKEDDFVARLFTEYQKAGPARIHLDVLRSDYMFDERDERPKLVEANTISVSFIHHSTTLTRCPFWQNMTMDGELLVHDANREIVRVFQEAMSFYEKDNNLSIPSIAVMAVAEGETNIYDQEGIIHLMEGRMQRLTFRQLADLVSKCKANANLELQGHPISMIYLRTGYDPKDYAGDWAWEMRRELEVRGLICIPTLASHLVGLKKIQEQLSHPAILHRFLSDKDQQNLLMSSFVQFANLQDKDTVQKIRDAPHQWVLKPQREGGGHLVTGDDIIPLLDSNHLGHYIAMERIPAKLSRGASLLSADGRLVADAEVVHEIGVFGVHLAIDGRRVRDEVIGALVRTKEAHVKEGGVAAGFSALNNLRLS